MTDTSDDPPPEHPFTIAIDVGGTGLKADVLDDDGRPVAGRVRVSTTYPMPPELMVATLTTLVGQAPRGTASRAASPAWSARVTC